ncbi:recombinase family protein [Sphaerisporangium perillae]|uniref:recombinase family protein n=1 Tax=Sphaerisporangium perillae TaxID=2935860 RepID=UPI0027DFD18B|nr:recombinase family protein [Sphaerisporangium perillae]
MPDRGDRRRSGGLGRDGRCPGGFAKLVTEVTMGRVGIVLGIEMSRLARTGRDWHQLLELCSLSGALLADPDGVYDPSFYNDRLLLGLKGTMNEAELYLIRQRMLSGRLAKAERGELAFQLPIGYVRRPSGEVVFDPDEQARHVVGLVFDTFTRLGTLNAVLRYLVDHQIQLPVRVRGGLAKGELEWRRPTRETLQIMLHNPIYAGYYAYGRRRVDPRRKQPGRPSTGRIVGDSDEWLVLLADRMPAYITVEQYGANLARMAANRQTAASPGAPRDGSALLAGLLRCGRCGGGHRMTVRYHTPSSRNPAHGYVCAYNQVNYGTGGPCQHIAGPALDAYVTGQVLAAVAPAALDISICAAAQAEAERAMLDKLWRQRLERARYAADRARRQYQLAEPENRLVVRQLEKEWEAALAETDHLQTDYQRFTESLPMTLTDAQRQAIGELAENLPRIWNAPTTGPTDRKELLRTLIEKITVAVVGNSELVDVTITWAGGHHTTGQAIRPVARLDQLSYYPRLLARVTELAEQGKTTRQIADTLNTEGLRPPKRTSRFEPAQIRTLLNKHGIIAPRRRDRPTALADLRPDEWTVPGLAAALEMPLATVYNWIYRGWINARHAPEGNYWIITANTAELRRLHERRSRPPGFYTRARWTEPPDEPSMQDGAPQ